MINHRLSLAVKVCDVFSGKTIDNAEVKIKNTSFKLEKKGNGFYTASNIKVGEYHILITAQGYLPLELHFNSLKDEMYKVCFLTPVLIKDYYTIKGKIKSNRRLYKLGTFYYSMDSMRYKGILLENIKKDDKKINVHVYGDSSLEGRRFALEDMNHLYTLGSFDYVEKKYSIKQKVDSDINKGGAVYLLFESQTNGNGEFEICIPKYLIENKNMEMQFYMGEKRVSKSIDFENKDIVLSLEF